MNTNITENGMYITQISSINNDEVWLSTENGIVLKYKIDQIENASENQEQEQVFIELMKQKLLSQ